MHYLIERFLNLPKTILFNYKYLPFKQASKLPIVVSRNTVIKGCKKGMIVINSPTINRGMIKIGCTGTLGVSRRQKSYIISEGNSKLIFSGKCVLSKGVSIRVTDGEILFGSNFYSNSNLSLFCSKKIEFGDNNLLGWDVCVRDSDGHDIRSTIDDSLVNPPKPITIGNNVWVGQNVSVLKGVSIADNSIVAMNSLVTRTFELQNVIIGGSPAKIIKQNVYWNC